MKKWLEERASVTLETAVLLPVVIAVLLLGTIGITFCLQYVQVQQCFYQTAEILTDYAYVYHEKTIAVIAERWQGEIQEELEDLLQEIPQEIQEVIDIKGYIQAYGQEVLDQAESQLYVPIANCVFQQFIKEKSLENVITSVDFSRSSFFIDEHKILLDLVCELPLSLPFLNGNKVKVHYSVLVNGWVNGVGGELSETDDIWDLDNFSRGKKIRHIYGANLPDNFPVIANFGNGRATMMKSIDFRKKTYESPGALSSAIIRNLQILYNYDGQSTPYGKEEIIILPTQIKEKELLLVIPNAEQNELVERELKEAKKAAELYGIIFTIKKL